LASPVECPAELKAPATAGGKATVHRLQSVDVFDGDPRELASLVPDEQPGRGRPLAIWKFAPVRERALWLACGYRGTSSTVTQELPAATSQCKASYKGNTPVSVSCS
jgi:hypothetical protein